MLLCGDIRLPLSVCNAAARWLCKVALTPTIVCVCKYFFFVLRSYSLAEIKHLHAAAKKVKAKHSEQVEKLSAQIQSRDKQIKESESKMSTIAHYVDQLEERLASFAIARKEISVREEKCKELEEKDEQQREEMAALRAQINDLTVEKDEMKSLIDLLVEERTVWQQDKAKLEKKIRKLSEESNLLKSRFAEKEEEVAKLGRDVNESNQKLNEAEQNIEELEGTVASVSNQLAEVERIAEENRVEATEKITRADDLSSQQQQKIEELFARVAAAEAPPPPPPLPVLVDDGAALDNIAGEEQTNDDVSDSSPPSTTAMEHAVPSHLDGSGTYSSDMNAEQYDLPHHDDLLNASADVSAVGGFEPTPSIEEFASGECETLPLMNQEYHDITGTADEESSTLGFPSRTSGNEDFFDAVQDHDDNDDMATVLKARGSEDTIVSEDVQVAEAILDRFDDGGLNESGDRPLYPGEDSLVEGVMRFGDKSEEVGSDPKDEEVDGGLASITTVTLEEKSPPSLPTSGQSSQPDCVIPPAPRRNVPFRKLRKSLSKATGLHGVLTPPSGPRRVPPPKGGEAPFGFKPKNPPEKKDLK